MDRNKSYICNTDRDMIASAKINDRTFTPIVPRNNLANTIDINSRLLDLRQFRSHNGKYCVKKD